MTTVLRLLVVALTFSALVFTCVALGLPTWALAPSADFQSLGLWAVVSAQVSVPIDSTVTLSGGSVAWQRGRERALRRVLRALFPVCPGCLMCALLGTVSDLVRTAT